MSKQDVPGDVVVLGVCFFRLTTLLLLSKKNLTAESGELTFNFSFCRVHAVGSNDHVYTIVSLVSSSLEGFVVVPPLGCGKAVAFLSVFSESRLLTMLSRFLYENQRSLSGSLLSIVSLSFWPGMERFLPPFPNTSKLISS